jgi:hypothetical protein
MYVCMYVFVFESGPEIVRGEGVSSSTGWRCLRSVSSWALVFVVCVCVLGVNGRCEWLGGGKVALTVRVHTRTHLLGLSSSLPLLIHFMTFCLDLYVCMYVCMYVCTFAN